MKRKLLALTLCSAILAGSLAFTNRGSTHGEAAQKNSTPSITVQSNYGSDTAQSNGKYDTAVRPISSPIEAVEPISDSISRNSSSGSGAGEDKNLTKALETVLKIVKNKITVPKEYSEFDYYYSGGYGWDYVWSLTWRNSSNNSNIRITCDEKGNIKSYYIYTHNGEQGGMPNYLKKELTGKAEQFIRQIAPHVSGKIVLSDSDYEGIYNGNYIYRYLRKENGILLPDNAVEVRVNSVTGEIASANISWTEDAEIPDAGTKITKEQAAQIIKNNVKMKLVYRMNYYGIYDDVRGVYSKKAFLVYEPDTGYIAIDAKTGEVYTTRSEWREKNDGMAGNDNSIAEEEKDTGSGGNVVLTEEEMAKLAELEKLITKEKAIEIVTSNKNLLIDPNLLSYQATLDKSYSRNQEEGKYVWNIWFSDPRAVTGDRKGDYYRAYASASVDARDGKILSFNASIKSNYDEINGRWNKVNIKYDEAAARGVLEAFLKEQVKDRFDNVKLVNTSNAYVAYYTGKDTPVYGGYYYSYSRFNEGIEFGYNGIYGSVDGVTGKIYQYYSNWDDEIEFESPKNAMTADQAFDKYISKEGYDLVYEVNTINEYDPKYAGQGQYYESSEAYSMKKEIRLVYRTEIYPAYISPFTGEQLNYDGSVYTKPQKITYSDIADTKENRGILILADMNIGFTGGKFEPNKTIYAEELNELLKKFGYGNWNLTDGKETGNKTLLTRESLAYQLIQGMNLGKVAKLKDIYRTGYGDENLIKEEYVGAVALAKGLGLMDAKSGSLFAPKDNVTRREAVNILFKFLPIQYSGIY